MAGSQHASRAADLARPRRRARSSAGRASARAGAPGVLLLASAAWLQRAARRRGPRRRDRAARRTRSATVRGGHAPVPPIATRPDCHPASSCVPHPSSCTIVRPTICAPWIGRRAHGALHRRGDGPLALPRRSTAARCWCRCCCCWCRLCAQQRTRSRTAAFAVTHCAVLLAGVTRASPAARRPRWRLHRATTTTARAIRLTR